MGQGSKPNRLASETSPYLLQHAHNPVEWYPWGEEAFARARAENRPIMLSIGYSACHWCHVMERESFENEETARLMNDLFVNVKVDREERPDVDDVYMKAVQMLTGRGGWPMTVFLTPDGKPFYGGTYFPPVDRHGLPGFPRLLQAVARAYRDQPEEVARSVERILSALENVEQPRPSDGPLDPTLPRRAADGLLGLVDRRQGGFGGAPKFPHAAAFQLLLRHHRASGRRDLLDAVRLTCERMAHGGLYDQIGGGFHRYTVDAEWLVPHFEKMLYDNAQLPRLYLEAFQATGESWLRQIAEDTLDYLLRDMRDPEGGFYAATDADSEGEEGKYFVWTPAEVAGLVEARDVELVCRYWDIAPEGNFEGKSIPHLTLSVETLAKMFGRSPEDAAAALARARARLLAARAERVPPLRDEKVLTSWNGLVIGTLAEAGRVLGAPRFVDAAIRAAEFIWTHLRSGGRLLHGWARGQAKQDAYLDDHAFLAAALVDLYEATGKPSHLARARELAAALDARFHDATAGGYFFTAADAERLITRQKSGADGSVPSGNGVAAHVLLRLHHLTGEGAYRARAEEILRLYHDEAAKNPFAYASFLQALEFSLEGPAEVVVVGAGDAPDTRALWSAVAAVYLPHRVLISSEPGAPEILPPARERPQVDGHATAYVCRDFTCSPPVTDPVGLRPLLEATRG
ncbi:MAG: thioredoxin domain-containing protein [Deltaproteobacteria bacterium]|nr:MAG: thioredoxin domain-containing protein [Deltaproteobacteria bacterium]